MTIAPWTTGPNLDGVDACERVWAGSMSRMAPLLFETLDRTSVPMQALVNANAWAPSVFVPGLRRRGNHVGAGRAARPDVAVASCCRPCDRGVLIVLLCRGLDILGGGPLHSGEVGFGRDDVQIDGAVHCGVHIVHPYHEKHHRVGIQPRISKTVGGPQLFMTAGEESFDGASPRLVTAPIRYTCSRNASTVVTCCMDVSTRTMRVDTASSVMSLSFMIDSNVGTVMSGINDSCPVARGN